MLTGYFYFLKLDRPNRTFLITLASYRKHVTEPKC